ncbi:baculoviral IAP repeat-containing protein 5 isoform X2 [Hyalella azteca]|uniref:Baculoviral IAP repeat-containing protein 5 isoform X2 n=1 Tax=Hyalella azteca TaxID=294128 RepID=A0A8B7NXA2_HYAAZ|nr:baculoviral IAP repeat-containing protein 5 isoform X2 [Hyalella azteca]
MDKSEELSLFFEKNRLKTFKNWPFKLPSACTKEKMAAAGFYFAGSKSEPDLACCFVCLKELDGWEEEDDPWEEHSRRGECDFIKLNKTEEEMTVMELFDLLVKRRLNQMIASSKKIKALETLGQGYEEDLRNS